jgi:putative endonuclease
MLGFDKEHKALEALIEKGYSILETNYSSRFGEIDIIAQKDNCIVFIEVKYRSSKFCGLPQEAVTKAKQNKIIKTAVSYIVERNIKDTDYRFDIIAISKSKGADLIEFIQDAFRPQGQYYL